MSNRPVLPSPVVAAKAVRFAGKPKGRQPDAQSVAEIRKLLDGTSRRRDLLIENLHCIQDTYGCLADRHLVALAHEMRLSMAEVYEVATFYHHFDVVKEGEAAPPAITVRVCDSLSCEIAGAKHLLATLPAALGQDVRVVHAPCVGRCETAPVAVVGQNPCPHATVDKVKALVGKRAVEYAEPSGAHPHAEIVAPHCIGYEEYVKGGGYRLLRSLVRGRMMHQDGLALLAAHADDVDGAHERLHDHQEVSRQSVAKTLSEAGLRGLGGAGFPAGRKWQIVADQPAPRLMAVNIDEGEPGTFKDRYHLERDPHRFLEGMLIAAWAVSVSEVYIYLRDEYHGLRALLERELAALRRIAGHNILPIHLRRGAGAYICGEESAMIESIEGKRGMPRLRPPYVAEVGLFGRPTLEHNVETLYWVRDILEKGPEWFASRGRRGRKGLRSFSVSGRVRSPGVHVAPAGITARELIDEYCGGMIDGHELYGYLPGGASGGILPASLGNVPLDFDTLQPYGCFIGSAAVVVLSQHDRAIDAARNVMRFFKDESCGQCTPCRVGTVKALALMEQPRWDEALLVELSQTMADASICGLGQAAPNPVLCVMKYFRHELE